MCATVRATAARASPRRRDWPSRGRRLDPQQPDVARSLLLERHDIEHAELLSAGDQPALTCETYSASPASLPPASCPARPRNSVRELEGGKSRTPLRGDAALGSLALGGQAHWCNAAHDSVGSGVALRAYRDLAAIGQTQMGLLLSEIGQSAHGVVGGPLLLWSDGRGACHERRFAQ